MKARTASLVLAVLLAWPFPGQSENVLRLASAISGLTFDLHGFNHFPTIPGCRRSARLRCT